MKFRWKFKYDFTSHGCLRCAIIKVLHNFKEKRAHKPRYVQQFFQYFQNKTLEILKMFKNNMKFTRTACRINSKISNRQQHSIVGHFYVIIMELHKFKTCIFQIDSLVEL